MITEEFDVHGDVLERTWGSHVFERDIPVLQTGANGGDRSVETVFALLAREWLPCQDAAFDTQCAGAGRDQGG